VLNHPGGTAGTFDTLGLVLDPQTNGLTASQTFTLFYERLLGYDARDYHVVPELAQKWEQISPTHYRFSLEPGVKWHDKPPVNGRPLTTDDVLYNFRRAQTNDPRFVNRSLLSFVDKVEAPDNSTIAVTTKAPNAAALLTLATDGLAFVAREAVEKWPKPGTADQVIGTGAFLMSSMEEGVGGEYSRNPAYRKQGQPYLDTLRTRQFNDLLTSWSAFQAGQVDVSLLPGTEVPGFLAKQGAGVTPNWFADSAVNISIPNVRSKPLDDARVVRALRLLIDHDEFISAWANPQYGHGGYGSIFPSALSAWDLSADEYRSHLEWKQPKDDASKQALGLLSAAGYSRDNPLQFTLNAVNKTADQAAALLLQAQWKRLGQGAVDPQLKLSDSAAANDIRATRSFTWANYGVSAGMPDPDIWLSSFYRSGASQNYSGFTDPLVDAMIDKQRGIFDETQRRAAVREIITYMIDHGPNTIGATRYFLNGVGPKVRGFVPEYYLNGAVYKSIWLAG
jgi:peptide/nickel transport system substrate-binding protein